jgi:hypothetical protein
MRQSIQQRTLVAVIAAALSLPAGSAAFALGTGHGTDKLAVAAAAGQPAAPAKGHGKPADAGGGQDLRAQQQAARAAQQQAAEAQREAARAAQENARAQQAAQRSARQAQRRPAQAAQPSRPVDRSRMDSIRHAENAQRQQAQAARVDQLHRDIATRQADKRASQDARRAGKRLAAAEQRQLIARQQAQVLQYRRTLDAQRSTAQRIADVLEQQNRIRQAQYVQAYNERLWQQQQQYRAQPFDYYNDPYFYSAPIYSYSALGRTYQTNQYGADLLREAINNGYREGLRAGRADEMDHWRADYRNSYAYQEPYYGYNGYYLDADQYAYYFRQGFQRGYEDGYYGRSQYGRQANGTAAILSTLLSSILNLRSY